MSELQDILRKVQALINQAENDGCTPEEADTFRNKAEMMMVKYRIDEAMLSTAEKAQMGITVQWVTIDLCDNASEFAVYYASLIDALVSHMEIRRDYVRVTKQDGEHFLIYRQQVTLCGFESDLLFVEAMFTSARLAFSQRLEPKYDPTLSDQVNAYNMRSAGLEGWKIAQAIYGKTDKALRPKVRKMFEAEALLRGEDPKVLLGKGINVKVFRESYAQGFISEYKHRLYGMRMARAQAEHGLVLAGRKDAIDDAFWTRYPERRPKPVDRQLGEANVGACPKCQKAKSGYCADHRWMRPRRGPVRYANSEGLNRGRAAARTVNIGLTNREVH